MSAHPRRRQHSRTRAAIESYLQPRTATMLVLGSACGLPLLTIANTLGLWLTDERLDDRYRSVRLHAASLLVQIRLGADAGSGALALSARLLGKRRSWMLVAQIGILIAFIGL